METGPLLIIWHSRTGTSEALAKAAKDGAGEAAIILAAGEVKPADILEAGG